ncbi:MAG TPA: hypothetical protein VGL99_30135, partial [Chloroflexota bacterium]
FINGCETTGLDPENMLNFVHQFVQRAGACGVIGTEITVVSGLAVRMGLSTVRGFLNGVAVGDALRQARLELLKDGNPLGLVYIPFVLGSLELVAAGSTSADT